MSGFEKRLSVSDDGPISGRPSTEDPRWQAIRNLSILGFVNKVAKTLDGENDRVLARALVNSALRDGESVRFRGITYTPEMQLDMYQRRSEPREAMISNKREWDLFCEALCKARDPNEPMAAKAELLRLGESMEARERPHAERMRWA